DRRGRVHQTIIVVAPNNALLVDGQLEDVVGSSFCPGRQGEDSQRLPLLRIWGPGRCGDYSPQLPQIRTYPIKVSGSSTSGFAMRPLCLHEADRKPLTLTRGVTVTGFGAAMGSAWFPPGGPPVGHALPSTGSSGASSPASTVVWRGATPCLPFAALR